MSEPIFDDLTISEHAARVTESVRAINHLSIGPTADRALTYPSDVSAVVSDLARAIHGLPQAASQLAARLDRLSDTGRVRDTDPDPACGYRAARASALLAEHCAQAAGRLARLLDAAGSDLSRLAYADGPAVRTAAQGAPALPECNDGHGLQL